VSEVKALIHTLIAIAPGKQKLLFRGKSLAGITIVSSLFLYAVILFYITD
jgi:hypothetical protein